MERAFGILKRRFPILQGVMRTNPTRACQYFGACTILHNIAIHLRDPPFEGDDEDNDHEIEADNTIALIGPAN